MVPQAKIDEVRRLLAEKKSYRDIARRTGVSRGTVGQIATGKRRDEVYLPDPDDPPPGPIIRCPCCGGRVYSPCLLCRVRNLPVDPRADRRRTADRNEPNTAADRRRCDPTVGDS